MAIGADKFKILRPFPVSDVSLVSSTVSATDVRAVAGSYNPATTYAAGDTVQVDSPTFTFTASGSLLTATAHGWSAGSIVAVSSTTTLPPPLVATTVYYLVEVATNTFKLSATKNGAPIITTGAGAGTHTVTVSSHSVYESLVGSNTGNTPHKSPTQWLDLGATNRWKPFDQSVTSQVEQITSVQYVLQTKGRVDGIALINVDGVSVTITAKESGGGAVLYGPVTYSLLSSLPATSYWSWFFDPIEYKSSFIDTDLPPYKDLELTIVITAATGGTVRCGAIIAGLSKVLGTTLVGASTGITDYSVKSVDDFGNYTITERTFRKDGNFQIMVDRAASDGVQDTLETYRATPVVYIGSSDYTATIIYGFYRDFTVNIAYDTYSVCSIQVEGLT
jgi:hypothetical protein